MNEKLKWFGRYLGCSVAFHNRYTKDSIYWDDMGILDHSNDYDMTCLKSDDYDDGYAYFDTDKCKLILKELKDISDEDFKSLINFLKSTYPEETRNADYYKLNRERLMKSLFNLDTSYVVVDFLRSKGYAIGIDKEYYITEEELKQ